MAQQSTTMVLKTRGLEYDDRVRKECESLRRLGFSVRIVVLEDENRAGMRTVWSGVEATSLGLKTREWFRHQRGLVFKLLEFNIRAFMQIVRRPTKIIWAHNVESIPLLALAILLRGLGRVQRVVWDQHELPDPGLLQNRFSAAVVTRFMCSCDTVIVANAERRAYMLEHLPGTTDASFVVLENLADRTFRDHPGGALPQKIDEWRRERPYILLQGGAHPGRHFEEVVQAVIDGLSRNVRIVVVGSRPQGIVKELEARWGERFCDQVFFTGWIPQMEIPTLIDHAIASLILYEVSTPNSLYCAPNRLYQAVARGTPVIVGSNPPMRNFVRRHGFGVVLDGTGQSAEVIAHAIRRLIADPSRYHEALASKGDSFLWESQDEQIRQLLEGWEVDQDG